MPEAPRRPGSTCDAHGTKNNKVLNTIGAAMGCTNGRGDPLDDFGDPALPKGFIDALKG